MGSFQERMGKFLDVGLKEGLLTLEDYNSIISLLEEAGKITTVHPELYAGLLRDSLDALPKMTAEAEKELSKLKDELKSRGFKTFDVAVDEDLWSLEPLGADASSCPMPIGMLRAAYISAMAMREKTNPIIVRDLITASNDEMGSREFKFYYQVQAEALIPVVCMRHIKENGKPGCVVIDGPLSASLLLRRVPYRHDLKDEVHRELQDKAYGLIRLRDELIKLCYELNIPVFSVVKRCTSRHFMAWYNLKDVFPYTDQFVFHQLLDYGQRTESISITKAIEMQGAEPIPSFNEIYGFYIKTSRNPLTPPVRVEYPQYLIKEEGWIASYVLTTSLTTYEAEFDGLPKAICLVHKDAKITRALMKEIYKRAVTKLLDDGVNIKILGSIWGFSLE